MPAYYGVQRSQEYLMHYGVKGMRWGVLRYQTKSGSLTPRGKSLIAKSVDGYLNVARKYKIKEKGMDESRRIGDQYAVEYRKLKKPKDSEYPSEDDERRVWDKYKVPFAKAVLKDVGLKYNKKAVKSVNKVIEKMDPMYDYDYNKKAWDKYTKVKNNAEYVRKRMLKDEENAAKYKHELRHPIKTKFNKIIRKYKRLINKKRG